MKRSSNKPLQVFTLVSLSLFLSGPALAQGFAEDWSKASRLLHEKKFEDSLKVTEKLVSENPKNALAYLKFAKALYALGRYNDAIMAAKYANKLQPNVISYIILVDAYAKTKQNQKARDAYNEAQVLRKPAIALRKKYESSGEMGNLKKAIENKKERLKYMPFEPDGNYNLAVDYFKDRNFPEASKYFEKAYKIDPKRKVESLYWLALIDHKSGNGKSALEKYKQYVSESPSGKLCNVAKQRIANLSNNLNASPKTIYGKIASNENQNANSRSNDITKGTLSFADSSSSKTNNETNTSSDTKTDTETKTEVKSKLPAELEEQARITEQFLRDQKFDEAYKSFKRLGKKSPVFKKSGEYHFAIGKVCLILGKRNESLKELKIARKLLPQDVEIMRLLGILYLSKKNYSKAYNEYKAYVELKPQITDDTTLNVNSSLAAACSHLGYYDEANKIYSKCISAQNRNKELMSQVFQNYAAFCHGRRQFNKAELLYKRAIEINPEMKDSIEGLQILKEDRARAL